MNDLRLFIFYFIFILVQRLVELVLAKSNEQWMKKQGAEEFGKSHYPWIVALHVLFLICFLIEKLVFNKGLSPYWPWILPIFFLSQAARLWVIASLGRYWNTKILVLPDAEVIRKGPYRFLKHPNYAVVSLELFIIPLLFNAFISALLFSLLNAAILAVRIAEEEKALKQYLKYEESFKGFHRFLPKLLNKCDN